MCRNFLKLLYEGEYATELPGSEITVISEPLYKWIFSLPINERFHPVHQILYLLETLSIRLLETPSFDLDMSDMDYKSVLLYQFEL